MSFRSTDLRRAQLAHDPAAQMSTPEQATGAEHKEEEPAGQGQGQGENGNGNGHAVQKSAETYKALIKERAAAPDSGGINPLLKDTLVLSQAGQFAKVADKLIDVLACLEAEAAAKPPGDQTMHATALHNLATALHHQGEFKAAEAMYKEAYEELSAAPSGWMECCMPSPRPQQLSYMASRAALLKDGKKPDPRAYLDADGKDGQWTDQEVEAATEQAKSIKMRDQPTELM
jgi:tetratricopeptide (TPR) repeat protein